MSNILVFSENRELLCEMLGKACELASDNQGVVASGWDSDEEYAKFGADKSYIFDKLSESGRVEDVVPCLKEIVSRGCFYHLNWATKGQGNSTHSSSKRCRMHY